MFEHVPSNPEFLSYDIIMLFVVETIKIVKKQKHALIVNSQCSSLIVNTYIH